MGAVTLGGSLLGGCKRFEGLGWRGREHVVCRLHPCRRPSHADLEAQEPGIRERLDARLHAAMSPRASPDAEPRAAERQVDEVDVGADDQDPGAARRT